MCQLLRAKSVATKESLLQSILEEFHYICKVHGKNVCTYCYALLMQHPYHRCIQQYYYKEHASPSMYRRAIYRRARRGGKLIKKKTSLATSPLRYAHTMFVFPPSFSQGIFMTLWTFFGNLWQPAIRERLCTQEGQERGEARKKKKMLLFLGHLSP